MSFWCTDTAIYLRLFVNPLQSYIYLKKNILKKKKLIFKMLYFNFPRQWPPCVISYQKIRGHCFVQSAIYTQEEANNTVKTMTSELTGHRNRNRAVNQVQHSVCSKLEHKPHRIIYLFWSFKAFLPPPNYFCCRLRFKSYCTLSLCVFFSLELA